MPGDVLAADGLPQRALDERDAALPARPQLGGAVEGAAVEVEVGLDEVVGQVGGGGAQHVRQQPGPPVVERHLVEHGREVGEVRRLPHAHLGEHALGVEVGRAEVGDVGVPVERRAQLAQLLGGHQVVGLLDVAGLRALPVPGGQPGVDLQDRGGRRLGRRVPAEGEQPGEVGDVRLPDLGELLLAVVGLVGQPEAALGDVEEVAVGVAVVGVDVGAEQAVAADPLELAEERRQVAHVAQALDRVDQRPQRPGAEGVDPLGVHERGEQVAHLAGVLGVVGAGHLGRVALGAARGELLDDLAHLLLGGVGEGDERPPGGAVGRDLGLVQPAAVDVTEEVVLGSDVGVHARAGVVEDAHVSRP